MTCFSCVLPDEINHTFVIPKMSYFSSTAYKEGLSDSFRWSSSFYQEDPTALNYYFDTASTICLHIQENTKIITERIQDSSSSHRRQVYWTDFIQFKRPNIFLLICHLNRVSYTLFFTLHFSSGNGD